MRGALKSGLVAAILMTAGCLVYASEVNTDYDKHADFSGIRTYS